MAGTGITDAVAGAWLRLWRLRQRRRHGRGGELRERSASAAALRRHEPAQLDQDPARRDEEQSHRHRRAHHRHGDDRSRRRIGRRQAAAAADRGGSQRRQLLLAERSPHSLRPGQAAEAVVEIDWPSGAKDVLRDLAANHLYVIEEGGKILKTSPWVRLPA